MSHMKIKILLLSIFALLVMLPGTSQAQQPDFDDKDAESLRQFIVQNSYGKALSDKQLKQFEKINTIVSEKGKIPINQIDDNILLAWINRQYGYSYEEYTRSKEGEEKYLWMMKRLYKSDTTVVDQLDLYIIDKKALKDAIKN